MRYGGVDPNDVCGGTTSIATGQALSDIALELTQSGCPRLGYSCPADVPHCIQGTCGT